MTATPSFTRTYNWSIEKAVDKTLVQQVGGTATFNYTVNASQTGFTDSAWVVSGKITITNPGTGVATGSAGVALAQCYVHAAGGPEVRLAVADVGIGVRASGNALQDQRELYQALRIANWSAAGLTVIAYAAGVTEAKLLLTCRWCGTPG